MDNIDPLLIAIPFISFFAFFLKGVTGTGTTTMVVALSSFIIDPKLSIVLASFINMFGGLSMLRIDPVPLPKPFWIPITITMIIGSIIGALTLLYTDSTIFKIILGVVFFLAALWFLFSTKATNKAPPLKEKATKSDIGIGLFAGFCGGFIGVNAPPLVLHFGKFLDKRHLRRLLVIIFIPAAIAQTATFWYNGILTPQLIIYALCMIPGMLLGIYVGNKSFHYISETTFKRILAVLLIVVSARLIHLGILSL